MPGGVPSPPLPPRRSCRGGGAAPSRPPRGDGRSSVSGAGTPSGLRIATVCTDERKGTRPVEMAAIRWYRISGALAELGHRVDIVHGRDKWRLRQPIRELAPRLREVPLRRVRWDDYDVVKTLFHRGFETLERLGGADHPFIVSKLGSVVDAEDRPGIYFYGAQREALHRVQERIHRTSRFVTLLTEPARELWRACHGDRGNLLLVPGAAPRDLPPEGPDPYPGDGTRRVLFAGNFYAATAGSQPEAHRTLADKLNRLGGRLRAHGITVYVLGTGDASSLDPSAVRYLGSVPYDASWDWLRHADVGLVVSAGPFMHNNESTKIYHYLRVGLPVVSEAGFPNDDLVTGTGHGRLVPAGDLAALEEAVREACERPWDRGAARDHVLRHHTWEARARVYDEVFRRELPDRATGGA